MNVKRILRDFPGGLVAALALTLTLMLPLAAQAAATLFGATGARGDDSVLYTIDKTTGAGAEIGPIGFNVSGIAFDPTTGILYGLSGSRDFLVADLVTIDTTTGAGTLVGVVTGDVNTAFPDITFDAAGQLYAWTQNGSRLVKIDKATAVATFVGPSGILASTTGLAFSQAGTLYLEDSGILRTIDPITGAVMLTIFDSGRPVGVGMDFDENDDLYALEKLGSGASSARDLVRVDASTGIVNTVGATVEGLEALAFQKAQLTQPPVALCRDRTAACFAFQLSVDDGSFDPDGGPVTLVQAPPGPYSLGITPVTLTVTDEEGKTDSCTAKITVVDTTIPALSCVESVNPSGRNVPRAHNTNQDGFYKVLGSDNCATPTSLVIEIGSFTLTSGETIKITQTPGKSGVRFVGTMGKPEIKHFQVGPGDAVITATDDSGNRTSVTCLVPPPPK